MKKQNLLLLLSALALAGCSDPSSSTSSLPGGSDGDNSSAITDSSGDSSDESGESESNTTPPVVDEDETYVIRVGNIPSGATVTIDKSEAKEGETVTVTVTVEDGFSIRSLSINGSPISVEQSGDGYVATFQMPDRSVEVTLTLKVEGAVTIQGGITAVLTEETAGSGIYVARNVKVPAEAEFSFFVQDTELTMLDLDYTKCFASIHSGGSDGELSIAGGATYDFYYDDNADPALGRCYVKKVHQDSYPNSPETLHLLFDGQARSESTMNPDDVLTLDYKNYVTDVHYSYQNHLNGSYATAVKASNEDRSLGLVSKKIDGDVYSVVNSYIDGGAYHGQDGNYSAYAAKYGIVETENDIGVGLSRYSRSKAMADYEAHAYSHDYEDLRFDFMYAYYVGYDTSADIGTDGLGLFERNIVSTATASGFDVDLDSFREIDTSNETMIDEEDRETSYYTYDADFSFDATGRLLSLTYQAKRYDEYAYDFQNHVLLDPEDYEILSNLEVAYTYGAATTDNKADDSAYFTSAMSATVRDEDLGEEYADVNAIQKRGDGTDSSVNEHLTLVSDKAGALDLENWTIIASSDPSVIGPRNSSEPYTFMPKQSGKATLTIGNPTVSSVPTTEIEVEVVDNIEVRSFYMTGKDGVFSASQELLTSSTSFTMAAGQTRTFRVYGSPYDVDVPFTPVSSNPDLLSVSSYQGSDGHFYLYYDARNADNQETVDITVTLNSDKYMDGFDPAEFTVTLQPRSDFSPIGDWNLVTSGIGEATEVDETVLLSVKEYDGTEATYSSVTYNGVTYRWIFNIDPETGAYSYDTVEGGNVAQVVIAETEDGFLGLILQADDASWNGQDEGTEGTFVFGYILTDEESQPLEYSFAAFAPIA